VKDAELQDLIGVFSTALEMESESRRAFVEELRERDPELGAHIEAMLRVHEEMAGSSFLALNAILPAVISNIPDLNLPPGLAIYLGGTTILIVVSVALDLVDKLNSYLVMRNYDGFMGGGKKGGR